MLPVHLGRVAVKQRDSDVSRSPSVDIDCASLVCVRPTEVGLSEADASTAVNVYVTPVC